MSSTKSVEIITLKVIGVLAIIVVLYLVRNVIGYLLLSFLFASALRPVVDKFETKKIPRFLGAFVIFILFIFFLLVAFWSALPMLVSEIQSFTYNFPYYWQNFLEWLPQFEEWKTNSPFGASVERAINESIQNLLQVFLNVVGLVYSIFGKIFNFLFVIIVAFYLTVEKNIAKRLSKFCFPGRQALQEKISRYWKLAEKKTGRWLQGYAFLSIVVGTLVYIGLSILGIKYALVLAVIAGLLEIVPWLGPFLSGAIGATFALLEGGWVIALWAIFVFFLVQQLENYLIVPLVMKNRVDVNPLLTIIVLFIGGILGGFVGMILAVPMTAIILAWWKESKENTLQQVD